MSKWDFGTFDCMQNLPMCLWTWCVPCGGTCMQACNAKLTDPDNKNAALVACLLDCCLGVCGAAYNRYSIRKKLSLEGSAVMDCICQWCCGCCSTVQEWQQVMKTKKGNAKIAIWELKEKK